MDQRIEHLQSMLASCDALSRVKLHPLLARLSHATVEDQRFQRDMARVEKTIAMSLQRLSRRIEALPTIRYDASLPIASHRRELLDAISEHQVVIVSGQTGSGKSTQLPLICLEAGRGRDGLIAHTQPRRIAARTIAARLSSELGTPLGKQVGYKVRHNDQTSALTTIKVLTDGMLLAEIQSDRNLLRYDTIIIDEAHERSLNIDFLLGYLRKLVRKRRDIRIIITSATIDAQKFCEHFGNAPLIEVSGRSYPVEIRYRDRSDIGFENNPNADENGADTERSIVFLDSINELCHEGPGDILVFLPGERDIREHARLLRTSSVSKEHSLEILPLYARLSAADQMRVFAAHTRRRVVLATNIAETSLTVPGIRYVVDFGTARISRYASRSRVQGLQIEPISQASANQRAGRCGRVAKGICIRLYSEDDYNNRPAYTDPEVLRSNLAGVILQMKAMGLGNPEHFPFLDRPSGRRLRDGYDTLVELGALDEQDRLTRNGRELAKIPVDPRIGTMLMHANTHGALQELLIIGSALASRDPRERPYDKRDAADQAHEQFCVAGSDFLTVKAIWDQAKNEQLHRSKRSYRTWCKEHYLSWRAMQEWHDLYRQLLTVTEDLGYRLNTSPAHPDAIHKSILSGLLCHIAMKTDHHAYTGANNSELYLHPSSVLFSHKPKWIVAAQILRTNKLYARMVAPIRPDWLVPIARHLFEKTYGKPQWDNHTASTTVIEKVSLYGLRLPLKRRIAYGSINPIDARHLFIEKGLVQGRFRPDASFVEHNDSIIAQARRIESKARIHDHHISAQARYDFYDDKLPLDVWSKKTFLRWLRKVEKHAPNALYMSLDDLLKIGRQTLDTKLYPDRISIDKKQYAIEYHHAPADESDGVELSIPLQAFENFTQAMQDWLVPGFVRDRVMAMVRSLPKSKRKAIGPAPSIADAFLASCPDQSVPLVESLAAYIGKSLGVRVDPEMFRQADIPVHLIPRLVVVDDNGHVIASHRQMAVLKSNLQAQLKHALTHNYESALAHERFKEWSFGTIDTVDTTHTESIQATVYPCLKDCRQYVQIQHYPTAYGASIHHRAGVRRLLSFKLNRVLRTYLNSHGSISAMRLNYAPLHADVSLDHELLLLAIDKASPCDLATIRTTEKYNALCEQMGHTFLVHVDEVISILRRILSAYKTIHHLRESLPKQRFAQPLEDIDRQLSGLLPEVPFSLVSWDQLTQYPRYFQAVRFRLEKLATGRAQKDQQCMYELSPRQRRYDELLDLIEKHAIDRLLHEDFDTQLNVYRWMLEEYRVSLFAQQLGTQHKVSGVRLDALWHEIRRLCETIGCKPAYQT